MVSLLKMVASDASEKNLKKTYPIRDKVNALEGDFQKLTDAQLRDKTEDFRSRLAGKESMEDLLPEAFAAAREVARRRLGQRHYDVQIMGGAALHRGQIAEMKTGEGKTLVATLPIYLNALTGKGVHLVTVNDYLARRDPVWMGPIYHGLGLSVGCLQHDGAYLYDPEVDESASPHSPSEGGVQGGMKFLRPVSRAEAYQADITYGTNNEFGFDYLRDNMALDLSQRVQRELNYAIVDEVDNILIDEARTPLDHKRARRGAGTAILHLRQAGATAGAGRRLHHRRPVTGHLPLPGRHFQDGAMDQNGKPVRPGEFPPGPLH